MRSPRTAMASSRSIELNCALAGTPVETFACSKMISAFGLASGVPPPEGFCDMHGPASKASAHSTKADDSNPIAQGTNRLGEAGSRLGIGAASAVPLSPIKNVGFSPRGNRPSRRISIMKPPLTSDLFPDPSQREHRQQNPLQPQLAPVGIKPLLDRKS